MKIDTMRRIDRLAGVPLCAVASTLLHIWWRLHRATPRPLRNVLFIELSEMGSAILADPAMRKARERLGATLFFAIFKRNADSLLLLKTVPPVNVFIIREDGLLPLAWDTLRFLIWARHHGIDTVIDLELFSRYTGLLTGLSGADRRVGFYRFHNEGLYRGEMLTHRVAYNPHIHIAKNFIALVNALCSPVSELPYSKTRIGDDELTIAKAPHDSAARQALLEHISGLCAGFDPTRHRLVLVNPNASDLLPQRCWMPERFAELARRILDVYEDVVVLITGMPAEREQAVGLAASVGNARCVSFAGRTALTELPALYSLAVLMVTNDSGPSHFAAVTDMPTIVLFGPETPRLYGPLGNARAIYAGLACSPCVSASNHRKTACTDNVCMRAIAVDEVMAAVVQVLSGVSGS